MKKFDFYGQFAFAMPGCLLAIDYNGFGIAYAGLFMFGLGVWQLLSTIINMASANNPHFAFFRNNFIIATVYIIVAAALMMADRHISAKTTDAIFVIMLAIPPFLIVRYWLGIGKIYDLWFLKKKESFLVEEISS